MRSGARSVPHWLRPERLRFASWPGRNGKTRSLRHVTTRRHARGSTAADCSRCRPSILDATRHRPDMWGSPLRGLPFFSFPLSLAGGCCPAVGGVSFSFLLSLDCGCCPASGWGASSFFFSIVRWLAAVARHPGWVASRRLVYLTSTVNNVFISKYNINRHNNKMLTKNRKMYKQTKTIIIACFFTFKKAVFSYLLPTSLGCLSVPFQVLGYLFPTPAFPDELVHRIGRLRKAPANRFTCHSRYSQDPQRCADTI